MKYAVIQSLPTLYLDVWSRYTAKLLGDLKMHFLSDIPTYEIMASSLYRLRRKIIPAAPNTQAELNVDLDWFLLSPEENIVKGDQLHKDGLRVILFASDDSLKIMARARTILADGTFKITPYLWYQTFILSAEYKNFNLFQ